MNRRTFNTMSLAAVLAPLPQSSLAQTADPAQPGYQIAEINDGHMTTGHGGMAKQHQPVHDRTLFQVASCSKTVTALAILTLVRDGKIDLDQPANRYLRRWKLSGPRGGTATIAKLMSHTAGTTIHGFAGYEANADLPNLLEILSGRHPANSGAVRTRRKLFREFKYSGGGTMVLQAVIEDVTGTGFASYTAAAVLNPIGASRATFALMPTAEFAHGFYEDGQPVQSGFRRHPESAAAGLWATASDLARVLQAVVQSRTGAGSALIPVELAQRMVTPVSGQSGLGVFLGPGAIVSHEGRNYGFDSVVAAELDTGRVRAAVTNRNGALGSYARKLVPE